MTENMVGDMRALRAVGILALAAALLGLALGTASGQQASRTVWGVVASGSAGGSSDLSGHTVTLHRVTMTGYDDVTTVTDADGAFSFDDFPYDQSVRYGVSVRYQGAIYGTDLDLSGGSPEPVELRVYESTSDDGIVSAGSAFAAAGGGGRYRPDAGGAGDNKAGEPHGHDLRSGRGGNGIAEVRTAAGGDGAGAGHAADRGGLRAGGQGFRAAGERSAGASMT